MTEQLGSLARSAHLMELRVADAARELLDHDLMGPRVGEIDLIDTEGARALGADNDTRGGGHGSGSFPQAANLTDSRPGKGATVQS